MASDHGQPAHPRVDRHRHRQGCLPHCRLRCRRQDHPAQEVQCLALESELAKLPLSIVGLDWLWLDERIEMLTGEIEQISHREAHCKRLMSIPGVGSINSTAMVATIGTGEAFERAWLGLVPRQYSNGGKSIPARISTRPRR